MKGSTWKKIAMLGTLMGTCFAAGVYAQDAIQKVEAYLRSDFHVVVNGEAVTLEHPPLIYNDSSYLPVKELASYVGAIVSWKDDTKTIYVNSRINPEQPTQSEDETYESITMKNPVAYTMEYLGSQYPVLVQTSTKPYYRLRDINRMGIDTNGLRKAKEIYTQELYVSEAELTTRWKSKPRIVYSSFGLVITGETDPIKLKTLKEYVDGFRNYMINGKNYSSFPIIIDALPAENEYTYLLNEDGHFYRTTLKLTKISDNNYVVGSYSKEDIETKKP